MMELYGIKYERIVAIKIEIFERSTRAIETSKIKIQTCIYQ